jgi:X-X-X-Leu-X-X-Gly heptad repeat protein
METQCRIDDMKIPINDSQNYENKLSKLHKKLNKLNGKNQELNDNNNELDEENQELHNDVEIVNCKYTLLKYAIGIFVSISILGIFGVELFKLFR